MAISTTDSIKEKPAKASEPKWSKEWLETGLVTTYIESNGSDDPIPVCLNGETVFIPVSKEVEIPRCIADIIRQSHRMMEESRKASKEYEDGKKKLN